MASPYTVIMQHPDFEERQYPEGTLFIGSGNDVRKYCRMMGVDGSSPWEKVIGCVDLKNKVGYSIDDLAIIEHELCHLGKNTDSHDICPLPFHNPFRR